MNGSPRYHRRFGDRCRAIRQQLLGHASARRTTERPIESQLGNVATIDGRDDFSNVDDFEFRLETTIGVVGRQPPDSHDFSGPI